MRCKQLEGRARGAGTRATQRQEHGMCTITCGHCVRQDEGWLALVSAYELFDRATVRVAALRDRLEGARREERAHVDPLVGL